jgi:molecular chaperone DnaK (HSP70)
MSARIAIDFGTTNSVVVRWDERQGGAELLALAGLSERVADGRPPLIPTLLYVANGRTANGRTDAGHAALATGLAGEGKRLFRNFKRGLVAPEVAVTRLIDGRDWSDREAGHAFMQALFHALPGTLDDVEQLALTAPVAAFESYVAWLESATAGLPAEKIQVVDESTAAALGYAVTEPGALVLVFDFGGGTLDLSLVQLPQSREKTGGFLRRLLGGNARQHSARVIAKAGHVLGGSDIDQWLLYHVLQKAGLTPEQIEADLPLLLLRCEQAKIELSTAVTTTITLPGSIPPVPVSRAELETILEENGFFGALHRIVDKVMLQARRQSIFREDIHAVLMVGGASLMPPVQALLQRYFSGIEVRSDKPFTAVAEGALQMAAGFGLEDYLMNGYALRHLQPDGSHTYEEIIPAGSRYPSAAPVEVTLGAAHPDQETVEFVIAELSGDHIGTVELAHEDGQTHFVTQAVSADRPLRLLQSEDEAVTVPLQPKGRPGEARLKACFTVDNQRQLRLSVTDLAKKQPLIQDTVLGKIR